jgi:5-hydroxyisourate hydrolase
MSSGTSEGPGPLTAHVLDTSTGRPAQGILVDLLRDGELVVAGCCGADGRFSGRLVAEDLCPPGTYRLRFYSANYFSSHGKQCFYPHCDITFQIDLDNHHEHFHVPLILSPHGYSTYRGS